MNKPIRTVSIFCLLLFLALMINATYYQFVEAGSLNDRPENRRVKEAAYSSERGAILVERTPIAESTQVDDEYQYLRTYKQPVPLRPGHRLLLLRRPAPASSPRRTRCSPATTRALFIGSLVDLLSNKRAAGRQRPADPRPRRPAGGLRRAWRRSARTSRARSWRSSRPPARSWRWCRCRRSTPTTWPPTTSAPRDDTYERLDADDDRAAAQPRDPEAAVPRARRSSSSPRPRRSSRASYDGPDDVVPGGDTFQLPQTSGDVRARRQRGPRLPRRA